MRPWAGRGAWGIGAALVAKKREGEDASVRVGLRASSGHCGPRRPEKLPKADRVHSSQLS